MKFFFLHFHCSGEDYLTMKAEDVLDAHLRRPRRGGQHECMRCTRFFSVYTQLFRLPCGLGASPSNNNHILESVLI